MAVSLFAGWHFGRAVIACVCYPSDELSNLEHPKSDRNVTCAWAQLIIAEQTVFNEWKIGLITWPPKIALIRSVKAN